MHWVRFNRFPIVITFNRSVCFFFWANRRWVFLNNSSMSRSNTHTLIHNEIYTSHIMPAAIGHNKNLILLLLKRRRKKWIENQQLWDDAPLRWDAATNLSNHDWLTLNYDLIGITVAGTVIPKEKIPNRKISEKMAPIKNFSEYKPHPKKCQNANTFKKS